jgi:hypothetical protein
VTTASGPAAAARPTLLWSTNTFLKHLIQQTFANDRHYVWCSPVFEGAALAKYAIGANQPSSSDPASIYRGLHLAVRSGDAKYDKILSQKKTLKARAVKWANDGLIDNEQRDEIFAMIKHAQIVDFRPLLYVIPYPPVASRVKVVPLPKRSGHQREYVITDLASNEFHIIEPIPCP